MNTGLVTESNSQINAAQFEKFIKGKTSLVAQGGGQRGIFTAGVLDAFLLAEFDPFDEFFGTSAGALNISAFLCQQLGLAKSFVLDLTTQDHFFNLFQYIRRKHHLGLDWAFEQLTQEPYRLNVEQGRRYLGEREAFAAVTLHDSLADRYLPLLGENWQQVQKASCAIPRLYPTAVWLEDKAYIDGGVSASIPVQEAWRREGRCIVVIRTESVNTLAWQETSSTAPITWLKSSISSLQHHWQAQVTQWKQDWRSFFDQQITKAKQQTQHNSLESLNGGRWLFGAQDVYRLSHLLGDQFDAGLADLLMVHYQTYTLTGDFLAQPPADSFIIQIAPSKALRSDSLMSSTDDLLHDYELGLAAGKRFIHEYLAMETWLFYTSKQEQKWRPHLR